MDRLTRDIQDSGNSGKLRNSNYLNQILQEKYPEYRDFQGSSKNFLLLIFKNIVERAATSSSTRSWIPLYVALDRVIKHLYPNINTSEGVFTEFRKFIRNKYGDNSEVYKQSVYIMGVPRDKALERREIYKNKVLVRNMNRNKLVPIYVEQVLEVIKELSESKNVYDLSLAVLLATGSRSIELFKVSKYEMDSDNPNIIKITGLAKDKGRNNLQNVVIQRNLVGLNSTQVVDFVDFIRNKLNLSNDDNKGISNKTNKILNRKFKSLFHPILIQNAGESAGTDIEFTKQLKAMTSHKARYIQGNVSYLIYGEPMGFPYESYLQQQYGHLTPDSTKAYLGINIKYKYKPNSAEELKELVKLNEEKTKELENKIDECCKDKPESHSLKDCKDIAHELKKFKNSFNKSESKENKIRNIVSSLKYLKDNSYVLKQKELQKILRYSSELMTEAYKEFRKLD